MQRITKYQIVCEKVQGYQVPSKAINTPNTVFEIANTLGLTRLNQEVFYVFCLNAKGQTVGVSQVGMGSLAECPVHPREVFTAAVHTARTCSIVLVHNHPSGDTMPSDEDIDITRRLIEAGKIMGIKVLDHVIVGDDDYKSMKSMGYC